MRYVVLDFETTGNQVNDRIIQAGLVLIEQGDIIDTFSSFVDPGRPVPPFITELTGISEEMTEGAPSLEEVVPQMLPFLDGSVLVAHQAAFDLGFLQRALDECGYAHFGGRVLDTIDLLKLVYPGMSSFQLSMAAHALGVAHDRPHQADSDAEVTARLFLSCLNKLESLPLLTLQRLEEMFARGPGSVSDLAALLQHIRITKEQQTDIQEEHPFFYRQFALNHGDWSEPDDQVTEFTTDAAETFDGFMQEMKQSLSERFPNYEDRSAQQDMMKKVYDALSNDKHLMIEAGTGTGKSLGYLTPSLYYALLREEKVIVSTHTINLQEQLIQKDIPLLQNALPATFRAALLKGRNHYLCLRKFEQRWERTDASMSKDELVTAAQMLIWLGETKHGDDEELHLSSKGRELWSEVASDSDSCLNRACPWFRRCYYHKAKNEANRADLVITNHSMLFTDMMAEHRLLPAYDRLVIDEAHHFEEVASKHLGRNVSYFSTVFLLSRLYKDARSGLLSSLFNRLRRDPLDKAKDWCADMEKTIPKLISVKEEWEHLAEMLYSVLIRAPGAAGNAESSAYVFRLQPQDLPEAWAAIRETEENVHSLLTDILKNLEKLAAELKEAKDEFDLQSAVTDLSGAVKELAVLRDDLRFFVACRHNDTVYWLEGSASLPNKSIQLHAVPLEVSGLLREHFFERKQSIVMTSATMSVNRSFEYAADRFGLLPYMETEQMDTVQLSSPFDYRKQALVCIPRDFPKVRGAGSDPGFMQKLAGSIAAVAVETEGRMLVLFTSYRMLREVYELLKPLASASGLDVIGQGVDSSNRSKLVHWFRESKTCILLGTSSFWEGVDIPGEALSCLAIVRLPFQPPHHPLVEARSEYLKKQNKNPFMEYAVPQAVIRFKQGFGRLIRRSSDKGVVIIYDTRVLETYYGKHFLYSLPGPKIEHMATQGLVPRIREWLRSEDHKGGTA